MREKPEMLGDAPIQKEYVHQMNELAKSIDEFFNGEQKGEDRTVGFVLMVFPLNNHDGRCNYISNANRKDIVNLLKEQVKRFEGQPDITGHA